MDKILYSTLIFYVQQVKIMVQQKKLIQEVKIYVQEKIFIL